MGYQFTEFNLDTYILGGGGVGGANGILGAPPSGLNVSELCSMQRISP